VQAQEHEQTPQQNLLTHQNYFFEVIKVMSNLDEDPYHFIALKAVPVLGLHFTVGQKKIVLTDEEICCAITTTLTPPL